MYPCGTAMHKKSKFECTSRHNVQIRTVYDFQEMLVTSSGCDIERNKIRRKGDFI